MSRGGWNVGFRLGCCCYAKISRVPRRAGSTTPAACYQSPVGGVNWLTVNSAPCGSRIRAVLVHRLSEDVTTRAPSRLRGGGALVAVRDGEGDMPASWHAGCGDHQASDHVCESGLVRPLGVRGWSGPWWRPGGPRSPGPGSSCPLPCSRSAAIPPRRWSYRTPWRHLGLGGVEVAEVPRTGVSSPAVPPAACGPARGGTLLRPDPGRWPLVRPVPRPPAPTTRCPRRR